MHPPTLPFLANPCPLLRPHLLKTIRTGQNASIFCECDLTAPHDQGELQGTKSPRVHTYVRPVESLKSCLCDYNLIALHGQRGSHNTTGPQPTPKSQQNQGISIPRRSDLMSSCRQRCLRNINALGGRAQARSCTRTKQGPHGLRICVNLTARFLTDNEVRKTQKLEELMHKLGIPEEERGPVFEGFS